MNDGLRPYTDYKPSGLPWLGKMPAHWTEKRAKYFFREVDERSTTGEEPLMSVSHKTGVTLRKSNVTMFRAESNIGHKICRPGDLAINTLWAWMAALGVSRQTGLVSPAYGVYRQRDEANLHQEYIDFLLRTPQYSAEYRCRSTGITASRLRLYPIDFLCIPLLQPPREEQELIVRYLRQHDARVRKFIRNRRRLIEVLNEQKQAIIHEAITHGLNSKALRKSSGVNLVGDVPQHWNLVPLCAVARPKSVRNCPDRELLSVYLHRGVVKFSDVDAKRTNATSDDLTTYQAIDVGDLVLNNQQAWRGSVGVSFLTGIVSPAYLVLTIAGDINNRFADYLFRSRVMVSQYLIASKGVGSIQRNLYWPHLKRAVVPCPPPDEQAAIANHLDGKLTSLSKAIDVAEREINLIRECRTRLIADVVTGKLDVRHRSPPPGSLEAEELAGMEADDSLDDEPVEEDADLVEESSDADD